MPSVGFLLTLTQNCTGSAFFSGFHSSSEIFLFAGQGERFGSCTDPIYSCSQKTTNQSYQATTATSKQINNIALSTMKFLTSPLLTLGFTVLAGKMESIQAVPPVLEDCIATINGEAFDAGHGTCETYAPSAQNNYDFCTVDEIDGIYAADACAECGQCQGPPTCPAQEPEQGDACDWQVPSCEYDCCCDDDKLGVCISHAECSSDGTVQLALASFEPGFCTRIGCDAQGNELSVPPACPAEEPEPNEACDWQGLSCKYDCCCDADKLGVCIAHAQCSSDGTVQLALASIEPGFCTQFGCDAQGNELSAPPACPAEEPEPNEACDWQGLSCKYDCCCDADKLGVCIAHAECSSDGTVQLALAGFTPGYCSNFGCDEEGNTI